jgi:hypothetical protein
MAKGPSRRPTAPRSRGTVRNCIGKVNSITSPSFQCRRTTAYPRSSAAAGTDSPATVKVKGVGILDSTQVVDSFEVAGEACADDEELLRGGMAAPQVR